MNTDGQTSYPVTERNRLRRVYRRGRYDKDSIHAILDAGLLCHVAYVIDGQPFCTPTIYWRDGETLYWHGSSASRMVRHQESGVPVCVTVSFLDGLVLARTAFHHSANFRSVMCFGDAHAVEDPDDKRTALLAMIERLYPGRNEHLRPMTAQEIKATGVIAMPIDEASMKVRAEGVNDDDADDGVPVWAGVIPVQTVLAAPEPCLRVLPGVFPADDLAAYAEARCLDEALASAQIGGRDRTSAL